MIDSADDSHASNYTCEAENMAGRRDITLQIIVTGQLIY